MEDIPLNEQALFLPDFGNELIGRSGGVCGSTVCVNGCLRIEVLSHTVHGLSVSGRATVDERCFAVSFDFSSQRVWKQFFTEVVDRLYLHSYDELLEDNPARAVRIDYPIYVFVDLICRLKESTYSTRTGETFTPLDVKVVSGVSLPSSASELDARHRWWLGFARDVVEELPRGTKDALQYCELHAPDIEAADFPEFFAHLSTLFVACAARRSICQQGFINDFLSGARISVNDGERLFQALSELEIDTQPLGRNYASCLSWYVSLLMRDTPERGSVEAELLSCWGVGRGGLLPVIHEGRSFLCRPTRPELPADELQAQIDELVNNHPGLQTIIEGRLSSLPREAQGHPEISSVSRGLLTHRLLKGIYDDGRSELVNSTIAQRVSQNLRIFSDWVRCLALPECELLLGIDLESIDAET